MKTYTINTKVTGFEADNDDFTEFLEYVASLFGRLFTYENSTLEPDIFTIHVPSDTNYFMLGMLWKQYKEANGIE